MDEGDAWLTRAGATSTATGDELHVFSADTVSFFTVAFDAFDIGCPMARPAPASLRAPAQPRQISGTGTIPVEPLSARMARLEAVVESVQQQLAAQLRRTGEIQAQLDRAVKAGSLRPVP